MRSGIETSADGQGPASETVVTEAVETGARAPLHGDTVHKGQDGVGRLYGALAQLPDQQRQMIVLARYEHHTASQIAQELQVPLATVYTQLRLGLHALSASLAA